jgi:SAM-dependent methyltransferase
MRDLHWQAPPGTFADTRDVPGVFRTIYERGIWGGGSGSGSAPEHAGPYMEFLGAFLHFNKVRSVVDVGCGDWQFSRHIDWGERRYEGIDVVPSVIEANRRRFGTPTRTFTCVNLLEEGTPRPSGDLLLMKDVLQHLSNENAAKLLALASRFRFSLITNDHADVNADCRNGDTRPLDIRAAPFDVRHAAVISAYGTKVTFLVVTPGLCV